MRNAASMENIKPDLETKQTIIKCVQLHWYEATLQSSSGQGGMDKHKGKADE